MRHSHMHVKLLLFGQLKEAAGVAEELLELRVGGSVADLIEELRRKEKLPAKVLAASAVAVNQEYVRLERVLCDGDEVAVLPPVSGGAA